MDGILRFGKIHGADLSVFENKHCKPCEGIADSLSPDLVNSYLIQLPGWELGAEDKIITRTFRFKGFLSTMSFVNAMAWIAEHQDHHPDFTTGYIYCTVTYTTHAISGLSEND
jgi:4a-hydroxytetrahydrobiopterin dehydratase